MRATRSSVVVICIFSLVPSIAVASGGVTYTDIARDSSYGLDFVKQRPLRNVEFFDDLIADPFIDFDDVVQSPLKSWGAPGVALIDYDRDGDLDIYATNGPNANNSLFSNQLVETGQVSFIDVAVAAGVGMFTEESTGVCFGDIDNDGDPDLYVLAIFAENRLFENQGGVFVDITQSAGGAGLPDGVGFPDAYPSGCSMGDVNGDGLLDIAIANTTSDWLSRESIFNINFAINQHNQLLLNVGGNQFEDVSATSGIEDLDGLPVTGVAGLTWAIAMVDYDLDGDIDIFVADDQAAIESVRFDPVNGVDRGILHLFENDGTGHFTDVTVSAGLATDGGWMGFSFGDVNDDGHMDFFATNHGDYLRPIIGLPYYLGAESSKWYLGQADKTFVDPAFPGGLPDVVSTPFGWGTSMADYDNDADTDIIFHGGFDLVLRVEATNPGVILANDGAGNFDYDATALAGSTDHSRRNVEGMAVGDVNGDGFIDIVSITPVVLPQTATLVSSGITYPGSQLDAVASIFPAFGFPAPDVFEWLGVEYLPGNLSVEISSADNGNRWTKTRLLGGNGTIASGAVNRDGIGAVVSFRTHSGKGTMRPVTGGSSYASQDELALTFGLGSEHKGRLDVLWPGGVRNRLYGVFAYEEITFPEIPCSYDAAWPSKGHYVSCVTGALGDYVAAGELTLFDGWRFLISALKAYHQG